MTLLRKEGNHLYNSIGNILIGVGLTEEIAYGTLNRSIEKLGLPPGYIEVTDIDGVFENLEIALCISLDIVKMSDMKDNIYKLKDTTSG